MQMLKCSLAAKNTQNIIFYTNDALMGNNAKLLYILQGSLI